MVRRSLLILALMLPLMAATPVMAAAVTYVVSSDGEPLLATGLSVHPGDRFIDSSNDVWSVTSMDKDRDRAIARRVARLVRPPGRRELSLLRRAAPRVAHAVTGAQLTDVAIYHTHGGDGSIDQAGEALANALSARGVRVIHRTGGHGPQDAYAESRRTAQELLETVAPIALFDIQRDAAPAGAILLVVGRSNPSNEANLAFARLVKARADELTPGLIKGIFLGQGSFNQDLTARSLLLMFAPSAEAEAAAARLAVSLPVVLRDLEGPGTAAEEAGAVTWRSAGSLLLAFTLLAALWMLVVHGGWRPAVARLLGHDRERR